MSDDLMADTDMKRYGDLMTQEKASLASMVLELEGRVIVLSGHENSILDRNAELEFEVGELEGQIGAIAAGVHIRDVLASDELTDRQRVVIDTLVNQSPASQTEMAKSLGISRATFAGHLAAIGEVWGIQSSQLSVAIVIEAFRRGVVSLT